MEPPPSSARRGRVPLAPTRAAHGAGTVRPAPANKPNRRRPGGGGGGGGGEECYGWMGGFTQQVFGMSEGEICGRAVRLGGLMEMITII